ncbi:unnamed protein product [Trichogramma brassicae]|uniref:Amino acid transporter transmembrane domain-containing protein n=1 Tax=Trichogramma brassicae TaxID=86971 RepID=A0A6H5ISJ6_9HYME|nr:unnamed protein product [Trichogramma brassicae]
MSSDVLFSCILVQNENFGVSKNAMERGGNIQLNNLKQKIFISRLLVPRVFIIMQKGGSNDAGSATHLIKSSLGTGILAMPNAIKNGGLLVGGIGTILIGILCSHCVHILVKSSHVLCRRTKTPAMTYADTAAAAFESGPLRLRKYSNLARNFVNWALCATYVSGACVYIVFIATGIKQLGDQYTGMNISIRTYMLCLIPAVVLLGQVRNLRVLVPFSVLANLSLTVGFAITLYYIFNQIQPMENIHYVTTWHQLPKFFATVIFAIEGIGTTFYRMSWRIEHLHVRCDHTLCCHGRFGYLSFGECAKASITLNLPEGEILGQLVQFLISIAILLTYGLQFFVPLEIIWSSIKHKFSHRWEVLGETVMRIFMVLLTVSVAMLVPDLDPFISLVGAVFFSVLGICIPAIIETISCWEAHLGVGYWRLWKNAFLVLVSIFALIAGSWISIEQIIELYTKSSPASSIATCTLNRSELIVSSTSNETLISTTLDIVNGTKIL